MKQEKKGDNKLSELNRKYKEAVKDFGNPDYNMEERSRILRKLRDLEEEIDKQLQI